MRGLEIEAIYENGVLKLPRELPLDNGQKVRITIHPPGGVVQRSRNRSPSPLSREDLERIALDPDLGPWETQ